MWSKIEKNLPDQSRSGRCMRLKFSSAIATFVVLLLVGSVAVYAFWGDGRKNDKPPGLSGAEEAGLFTELNMTEEIDGVTVTLIEAYADSQRIALSYEVAGMDPKTTFPLNQLTDADGVTFSEANGGFDHSGPTMFVSQTFYTQIMYQDDDGNWQTRNYMDDEQEEVDLVLTIYLQEMETPGPPPSLVPGGDNGLGPFGFEFTIPVSKEIVVEPQITEEVHGISITLESLSLAPSQSQAHLCIELPDAQDWQPKASITIKDTTVPYSGLSMTELPTSEDTVRCFDLSFDIFYDSQPDTVIITVDKLQLSTPKADALYYAEVERILLQVYGIDVDIQIVPHGVTVDEVSRPDGMTDEEFWGNVQQAYEDASPAVEGPWIFEVAVE